MAEQSVAYVLMGYPRISELFIASEIARVEQQGVALRLIVMKPSDEATHHPVVDRIVAQPVYLQDFTSLSDRTFTRWLRDNLPQSLGPMGRVARRHPLRLARTAGWAAAQSWRDRRGWRPRAVYLKEWMRAAAVADELNHGRPVTHIHAHFAHRTTTVAWWAAHVLGLPFSFTGHAKDIYQADQNPHGLLERKMRAAAFVVTCTDANRRHLQAISPSTPVHVVYHGLNADFSRLLADAPPAHRPDRLRVISVGRLVAKKGFDVLVDALALLTERGVDVTAAIAGEPGPEGHSIRERVATSGLAERVEFLGTLSQAELFAEYRRSNVFALACRITDDGDRDGIPNVMMEAMAAELPVVSTAVSGIPELVETDVNGLLVPPEDAAALADAIWRLSKDPALAQRLAAAGANTIAEHFDGEVLARRMAELFAGSGP